MITFRVNHTSGTKVSCGSKRAHVVVVSIVESAWKIQRKSCTAGCTRECHDSGARVDSQIWSSHHALHPPLALKDLILLEHNLTTAGIAFGVVDSHTLYRIYR